MVTLIIAEKPNVARKIAYALAEGKPVRKTIGKVSYYEFTRDGKKVIVAPPAVGHLFSLAPKTKTYGYPVFDIEWVPPVYVAEKGGRATLRTTLKPLQPSRSRQMSSSLPVIMILRVK